jgi:hypothetical protein
MALVALRTSAIAVAVLVARGALADAIDPAAAEALFRQAREKIVAGDYGGACPLFKESLRLDPAPGTLLNLAECEERTGHLASAWEHFERLEHGVPATDERFAIAQTRRLALDARVPRLVVRLSGGTPAGARVFRDDVEIAGTSLGIPLPVEPGVHVVSVVVPGRLDGNVTVQARDGETLDVVALAGRAQPPSSRRIGGFILGAGGIVSLGTGAAVGALALVERHRSDARCSGGICADPASLQDYASARSNARVADVLLGIGVVAVAVGGALLLSAGSGETPRAPLIRARADGVGIAW